MFEPVFHWVDPEKLAIPLESGTFTVYRYCWWMVNAQGEVAFYQGSKERKTPTYDMPQCNASQQISELLAEKQGYEVKHIDIVFVPHRCDHWN